MATSSSILKPGYALELWDPANPSDPEPAGSEKVGSVPYLLKRAKRRFNVVHLSDQ